MTGFSKKFKVHAVAATRGGMGDQHLGGMQASPFRGSAPPLTPPPSQEKGKTDILAILLIFASPTHFAPMSTLPAYTV